MSTGNSIQGSVGFDLAPGKRDLAEAERNVKASAARMERALAIAAPGGAGATRRMGPILPTGVDHAAEARAERRRRNSAAGFAPARPGQYLPVGDEAGRGGPRRGAATMMRGARGLVALGGGNLLVQLIEQTGEELLDLRKKISAATRLSGASGFSDTGEIQSRLSASTAASEELRNRKTFDRTGYGSIAKIGRQAVGTMIGLGTPAEQDAQDERDSLALKQKSIQALTDLAEKQTALNSVRAKQQMSSERQAALDEEEIEHRERLGKLAAAEAAAGVDNPAAIRAEQGRSILARSDINRRFNSETGEQTFRAGQQGIAEGAARGVMAPRHARSAAVRARQARASRRALEGGISDEERTRRQAESRGANLDVFEEAFQQSESMRGPEGAATRKAERMEQRRRSAFFGRNQDAAARKARGAKDEIALGDAPREGKMSGDNYNSGPSEDFQKLTPLVKDLVTQLKKLNSE